MRPFLTGCVLASLLGPFSAVFGVAPALAKSPVSCQSLTQSKSLLQSGFKWSEGPAWDSSKGAWLFSDVMGDAQYIITSSGRLSTFRKPSGFANGNAVLADGGVISAQHDRQLVRLSSTGELLSVLAAQFNDKPLNSPNDVAIAADGSIWFTDPPMGIIGYGPALAQQEQPFQGIFRLTGSELSLISRKLDLPNGIAFNPDQSLLYVSDTKTNRIYRFTLAAGVPLQDQDDVFTTLQQIDGGVRADAAADGLRVDRHGNVWATGPGGITILNAEAQVLCRIPFPDHVSSLGFGGLDGRQILVTSSDKVYLLTSPDPL